MKVKTINTALNAKFADWVASITDPMVRELVQKNTIITGGCIVSMLLKEQVNDYDLYFRNEATALAVVDYYAKEYIRLHPEWEVKAVSQEGRVTVSIFGSKNESTTALPPEPGFEESMEAFEKADETPQTELEKKNTPKYSPLFLSSNAITLSTKVQLIIRFYGEPDEVHENYDFVHCTNYWTSWDGEVTLRTKALEAILTKELRYVGSRYPVCSVIRTRKFLARGWTINAGQYVKMAFQISKLDLEDTEVLKDQLVGVDSSYFFMLISELSKASPEDGPDTGTRLMTIIDRIF